MFTCDQSQNTRKELNLRETIKPHYLLYEDFTDLPFHLLSVLPDSQLPIFSVGLWAIWKHRNLKIWENVDFNPKSVSNLARDTLCSWVWAQNTYPSPIPAAIANSELKWEKPPPGFLKCNFDFVMFESSNQVGFAFCYRDEDGAFVAAHTRLFHGLVSVEEGELYAMRDAFKYAEENMFAFVHFESDCELIVKAVLDTSSHYVNENGPLISSIRSILLNKPNFKLLFVEAS